MRWRWWWPFGERDVPPSPELVAAREKLAEVKAKDHEVFSLGSELRRIRERNNFASLFGGGNGSQDRR